MNLASAPARAEKVTAPKEAARMYADIEYELAMGDPPADQEHAGEQALSTLEDRFPDIKTAASDVVEDGHLPHLSRTAKRNLDKPAPMLAARPRGQHSGTSRPRTARQRVASATGIHALPPRRGRASRVARMRYQQTGIPAAGESVAQMTMRTLGTVAGLSFLYLMVSDRGSTAVQSLGGGVAHALQALVNPATDPLRPRSTSGTVARRPRPTLPSGPSPAGTTTLPGVNHSVLGHHN